MIRSRLVGVTLVELLVVIFVIGVLVALLLPAIQAAREAARRVQCKNHVKQLALAAVTHEEQIGHFPTGGWHSGWVGDKDRGFGRDQPGGWAYNILPFLEESSLHDVTGDGKPDVLTPQQLDGVTRLAETALPVFNCPSRRPAIAYPFFEARQLRPAVAMPTLVGKLDYAINLGEAWNNGEEGPETLERAEYFEWCNDPLGNWICETAGSRVGFSPLTGEPMGMMGVSFRRSEVGIRHVTDGTSNTYLIGEKRVHPALYTSGPTSDGAGVDDGHGGWMRNHADWTAWCVGLSITGTRWGGAPPRRDRWDEFDHPVFGSAHRSGFHMAFCDGSVRVIDYGIDSLVHRVASHRRDGTVPIQE